MSKPGRPSQPLDPAGGALLALAHELRVLRHRAALTLREVAAATSYSVGTCTAASRGKQLPTWDVTAAYTRACGGDEAQVRKLWEEAACSLGREITTETPTGDPPDPSTVSTAEQFLERMAELRAWARLPLRALNQKADGHNALPPSTVSETLKRGRLPDAAFVSAFVTACGISDDQAQAWMRVRDGLSAQADGDNGHTPSSPAPPPPPDPRWLARWLRALVGVREEILDHAPHERGRYTRRGLLVLLSPIVAGVSLYLAMAPVIGRPALIAGVVAGIIWTFVVLFMDSRLVASLQEQRDRRRAVKVVLVRVVTALLVGIVIAEPLTLKIFQRPIEQQVHADRQRAFVRAEEALLSCNPVLPTALPKSCASHQLVLSAATNSAHNLLGVRTITLNALNRRVETNRRTLANLQSMADQECAGQPGRGRTGVAGDGPNCLRLRTDADAFYRSSHLAQDQKSLVKLATQVAEQNKTVAASIAQALGKRVSELGVEIFEQPLGLLVRLQALNALTADSPLLLAASWLMRLLLVLMPITPVLLTWLEGQTLYKRLLWEDFDRHTQQFQERLDAAAAQELKKLHDLTQTISDLLHRLPSPQQHPDLFLDITVLRNALTEVRARLDKIADTPEPTPDSS